MSKTHAIVGAGAVGLYYGGRLAAAGEDVRFLLRSDYEGIREHGLTVTSVDGDFRIEEPNVFRDPAEIGAVDVVIVTLKATANAALEGLVRPLLHEGTRIVTLQNGLGNTEFLAGQFGAERILGGLCFVCINRLQPGLVSHTGGGMVTLGDYGGQNGAFLEELVGVMTGAGVNAKRVSDLEHAQWVKLVWNVPFNGLCIAEGGIDTEALLNSDGGEEKVRQLMKDVLVGAAALGHVIPESMVDEQVTRTYPMGPYRPSSMIDYVEGREVEVRAIWEEPLRRAREAGADLVAWEQLLKQIQRRLAERDGR